MLFCLILISKQLTAQENYAGRVEKGDIITSLGLGIPSPLRIYLNRINNNRDMTATGYGPNFIKIDYMLSNKFSIGLNASYSYSDVQWMQDARNPATGLQEPYRHGVDVWEGGVGLRGNYYFLKKKNWNLYSGLGIGAGRIEVETYTFAPRERIYIHHVFPTTLSFEGTIGARYFLAQNFAIYSEMGIGQSWFLYNYYYVPAAFLQIGISLKL